MIIISIQYRKYRMMTLLKITVCVSIYLFILIAEQDVVIKYILNIIKEVQDI